MKNDIDFDELDKAVNSLMGGVAATAGDDAPKPKTLTISTTLKPGEKPSYEKLGEVAKNIGSETLVLDSENNTVRSLGEVTQSEPQSIAVTGTGTPEPTLPPQAVSPVSVPRPTNGRFMDVVHPSSDMRPAPVAAAKPEQIPESAQSSVSESRPKTSVLDEIEFSSPFLPDAKVEKRPLGDFSATPATKSQEQATLDELEQLNVELNDAPEEIVAINSEVVARDETKDSQAVLDATKIENVSSEDQQLQAIESVQVEAGSPDIDESLRAVESVDTGASSKEHAAVIAEAPQGAIYDVDAYHQPLTHPAKQKSGWGVVVIIVIIIILAAALGAGAFLLLGLSA